MLFCFLWYQGEQEGRWRPSDEVEVEVQVQVGYRVVGGDDAIM